MHDTVRSARHVYKRSGLVAHRLRHKLKFLLQVGSQGLVFAAACSSCFPLVVRIAFTRCQPNFLPTGESDKGSSCNLEGGPRSNKEVDATSTWHMLEGWENRPTSSSLGPVSGMVVLPDVRSDEQEARWFDSTTNNNVRMIKQRTGVLPVHARSSISEENVAMGIPEPRDTILPQGRRVVLATGTEGLADTTTENGSVIDPSNALCILEHGLGLDIKAEGKIGLHEGITLFAQPVVAGVADCPSATQPSQLLDNKRSNTLGQRGENDQTGCSDAMHGGHVLLLSDRVRSRTHILVVSPEGEVAPAVPGATEVRKSAPQAPPTCTGCRSRC